jgi:hypothetical protein
MCFRNFIKIYINLYYNARVYWLGAAVAGSLLLVWGLL